MTSPLLPSGETIVRPLTPDDSQAYRDLRQRILAIGDGRYFADSYMRENQLTSERAWRDWCTEKRDHCIFGTFLEGVLIGVMMITRHQNFNGCPTVEWEATWLDPAYRSLGVAKAAYRHVQRWTVEQGYSYALAFIRADNIRSRDIRKRQGFRYITTKRNEIWADGSIADLHAFVLDLRMQPNEGQAQALRQLRGALVFLRRQAPAQIQESAAESTYPCRLQSP
jgi:L-amino acid N-acyltransferase YncA